MEQQTFNIPEPLQLISIKEKLMPYCTPQARMVLSRSYDNTVYEYDVTTNQPIDYKKVLQPIKEGKYRVQWERAASLCQYIAIEVRCRFGERATKDMDGVVAFQLAGLLNQLVKEDYIHKYVFQNTPVSVELGLTDEKRGVVVDRDATGKWKPFPTNTNTPYGPASMIADLERLQQECSATYDPTIDEQIKTLECKLNIWNKVYTEEEVLDLTYHKMYMMGIYFTEKFDKVVMKQIGGSMYDGAPWYSDYNRFLGRNWIILEGSLPSIVITL